MKVVRLSSLNTGRLYPQEIFVVLIPVRGRIDPRAIVRPEWLCQWQITTSPSEIEPATIRLAVPQPTAPPRAPGRNIHAKIYTWLYSFRSKTYEYTPRFRCETKRAYPCFLVQINLYNFGQNWKGSGIFFMNSAISSFPGKSSAVLKFLNAYRQTIRTIKKRSLQEFRRV